MTKPMSGAFIIAGKDLRGLFLSPIFYVVAGISSLAWSAIFYLKLNQFVSDSMTQMVQSGGQSSGLNLHNGVIAVHFSTTNLVLMFTVGALTMRLFTEEKRQRTYDLLMTAPVTAAEIVLGKFMAGILTVWALIGVSTLYPLTLIAFAHLEIGPLLSSIAGLMLLSASYVAIGVFASIVTESTVLAVVLSFVFNLLLWFMGIFSEVSDDPTLRGAFDQINVGTHFTNFLLGRPSLAGFVFFASVVAFFFFITERVVESTRWR